MSLPDDYQMTVPEKKKFDLLPEDVYNAVITSIELKKDQPVYQSEDKEDKLAFEFTIVEEGPFQNRKQWLDVRPIMSAGSTGMSPSWLYRIVLAVTQIQLNEEDMKKVTPKDVNALVGKSVRIMVKQAPKKNGEMKNKISDVLPVKKTTLTKDDFIQVEDLPNVEDNSEVPF